MTSIKHLSTVSSLHLLSSLWYKHQVGIVSKDKKTGLVKIKKVVLIFSLTMFRRYRRDVSRIGGSNEKQPFTCTSKWYDQTHGTCFVAVVIAVISVCTHC
jgi:hypothetical protein